MVRRLRSAFAGAAGFSCWRLAFEFLGLPRRARSGASEQEFSVGQVIAWAKDWRAEAGRWPTKISGEIPYQHGLTWGDVENALRYGRGGLPAGASLRHVLACERRFTEHAPLTEDQILRWADLHYDRVGVWPSARSGRVVDAPDETWWEISIALIRAFRGLPGGSSLRQLLIKHRPRKTRAPLPDFEIPQDPRVGRRPLRAYREVA